MTAPYTPQQERIIRMGDAMMKRGKRPEEVQAFMARAIERDLTNTQEEQGQSKYGRFGRAGGAVESFTENATLGLSGLAGDAILAATDRDQSFGDVRQARRDRTQQFRSQHPVLAATSGIAGAIAPALASGGGTLAGRAVPGANTIRAAFVAPKAAAASAGLASRVARGPIVTGMAQAGAQGAVERLGTDENVPEGALGDAGTAGLFGAGLRGLFGVGRALGEGVQAAGAKLNELRPSVRVEREFGRAVDEAGGAAPALARLGEFEATGRGDVTRMADVLGTPATSRMNKALEYASNPARDELTAGMARSGSDARFAGDVELSAGRPRAAFEESPAEFRVRREGEVGPLYEQARAQADEFDAIPGRVDARLAEMERMASQKALPAPGQSTLTRTLDAPFDDAFRAEQSVRRGQKKASSVNRVAAETDLNANPMGYREPDSPYAIEGEVPKTFTPRQEPDLSRSLEERPVKLQAANDVNVRRPFESQSPVPSQPNRFTQVTEGLEAVASRKSVQKYIKMLRGEPSNRWNNVPDTDHRLLQEASSNMFKDAEKLMATKPSKAARLNAERIALNRALSERAPALREANSVFAKVTGQNDAYERGFGVVGSTGAWKKVRDAKVELTRPEDMRAFQDGMIADLFEKVSKASGTEFGEGGRAFKSILGKPETTRALREALGDDFVDQIAKRARQEVQLLATDAKLSSGLDAQYVDMLAKMSGEQSMDALIYLMAQRPLMGAVHVAKGAGRSGLWGQVTGRTTKADRTLQRFGERGAPKVRASLERKLSQEQTLASRLPKRLERIERGKKAGPVALRGLMRSFVPEEDQ